MKIKSLSNLIIYSDCNFEKLNTKGLLICILNNPKAGSDFNNITIIKNLTGDEVFRIIQKKPASGLNQ